MSTKLKLLLNEAPPVCLHMLGQSLVNVVHAEGREVLAQRDDLARTALAVLRTAKGHRWEVNHDEPDTLHALRIAALNAGFKEGA